MKKVFLTIFLSIFLFSCGNNQEKIKNNEIQTGKISTGNIEKEAEKIEKDTLNVKFSGEMENKIEIKNGGFLILNMYFFKDYNKYLEKNKENEGFDEKFFEYFNRKITLKGIDENKEKILKEFPDFEKNISEDKIKNAIYTSAYFDLKEKEPKLEKVKESGSFYKISISQNYNPEHKGSIFDFPYFFYYCNACFENGGTEGFLTSKNIGNNQVLIENKEEDHFAPTSSVALFNGTFDEKIKKINIDFTGLKKLYEEGKMQEADFSLGAPDLDNISELGVEKITYNNGKILDLNDEKKYKCDGIDGKINFCGISILEDNKLFENLTIYLK